MGCNYGRKVARGRLPRVGDALQLEPPPDGNLLLRVPNVARNFINKLLKCVGARELEIAAAVRVRVDVHDRLASEFVGVLFGPLGRAEQSFLLPVPRAVNDSSSRLPSLPQELRKPPRFFEQRHLAGDGIFGAIDPGVVVVPANDPFIGKVTARDPRDDVVNRLDVPIENRLQVNFGRPRAETIGDAHAAAPALGRDRSAERGKQRPCVGVGDGQGRNLRENLHVLEVQALGFFRRP